MSEKAKKTYKLGDKIWVPKIEKVPVIITCPDCLGQLTWKVTLPSGEEFAIACPRCLDRGYGSETARGHIQEDYTISCTADQQTITEMALTDKGTIRYSTNRYIRDEEDMFDDEQDCIREALKRAELQRQEEYKDAVMQGKRKGRSKRDDTPDEVKYIEYDRKNIRQHIDNIQKSIESAARRGVVIDLPEFFQRHQTDKLVAQL